MNRKLFFILLGFGVIILGILIGLRLRNGEDVWLCQNGKWIKHGNPSVSQPTSGCGNPISENTKKENLPPVQSENSEANIIVDYPRPNDEISSPLVIRGRARVFENQLNFRLKDEPGKVLAQGSLYANSSEMGQFGDFEQSITFSARRRDRGTLEVFDYSAKDGSEIDKVTVPLRFR